VGELKEYVYRGLQQLPIIIAMTSFVYTIATGSLAHMNIFVGMAFVIPFITFLLQTLVAWSMNAVWANSIFWKRSGNDVCNILPSVKHEEKISYFDIAPTSGGAVPSYWLMEVAFFIGYAMSNAGDSLMTPAAQCSSDVSLEKRNSHAMFVIVMLSIFAILTLFMRLFYMRDCEWSSWGGSVISILCASGAAALGYGSYVFSRKCGARSSDLFGILSQILPSSSTSAHPIVCTAD